MSTRREFARQVVGAIVGVSAIPPVGNKPRIALPIIKEFPSGMGFNFRSIKYSYQAAHHFHIPPYVPLSTSQRSV